MTLHSSSASSFLRLEDTHTHEHHILSDVSVFPLPPPSLAWGFYNSLRTKSVASCKEPQVRETHCLLLLHLACPPLPRLLSLQWRVTMICLRAPHASTRSLHASSNSPSPILAFYTDLRASLFFFFFSYSQCMSTPGASASFCLIPSGFFGACAVNLNSATLSFLKPFFVFLPAQLYIFLSLLIS